VARRAGLLPARQSSTPGGRCAGSRGRAPPGLAAPRVRPSPPSSREQRPPLGQEGSPAQPARRRNRRRSRRGRSRRKPQGLDAGPAAAADPRSHRLARAVGPENTAPQAPGMARLFAISRPTLTISAAPAAQQASRKRAKKPMPNVPSPSPEFDRLEPSLGKPRRAIRTRPIPMKSRSRRPERYNPASRSKCRSRRTRSAHQLGGRSRAGPSLRAPARCFRSRGAIAGRRCPDPGRAPEFCGANRSSTW